MFSSGQLRTWATKHLKGGAWYLDCTATWTHPKEEELRQSLEVPEEGVAHLSELPHVDEFPGLDDEARERAIAKQDAADKKKVDKVAKLQKRLLENLEKRKRSRRNPLPWLSQSVLKRVKPRRSVRYLSI
jgi:hypothetical protein